MSSAAATDARTRSPFSSTAAFDSTLAKGSVTASHLSASATHPLRSPRALAPIVGLAAFAVARRFMREYAARTETGLPDPDVLSYFEAMHSVRILLEIEQHRQGRTAGDRGGHPWLVVAPEAAQTLEKWSGHKIGYSS